MSIAPLVREVQHPKSTLSSRMVIAKASFGKELSRKTKNTGRGVTKGNLLKWSYGEMAYAGVLRTLVARRTGSSPVMTTVIRYSLGV